MENRKTCIRCRGRMFLEYDYVERVYEYSCISCGRSEAFTPVYTGERTPSHMTRQSEVKKAGNLTHV